MPSNSAASKESAVRPTAALETVSLATSPTVADVAWLLLCRSRVDVCVLLAGLLAGGTLDACRALDTAGAAGCRRRW
ncbi:hypothetical protein OH77DRAFT_1432533 [Trametes cingulata]|nr:hypothetical protein OH77DRAFT_1432533 [Trametes cingulata]